MRFLYFLLLVISTSVVFATLPGTAVIEIRTTGSSNNGGGFNSARGGTDYSQQDAAQLSNTDGAASGTTTFTSAGSTFTSQMVGNYLHITVGGGLTVGWYEIVTFTDANNVVLDRTPGTGSAATFFVGGALTLGTTLDDDIFEIAVAGNIYWIKAGTYTLGEAVGIAAAGTTTSMITLEGYNSTRGDLVDTKSNRPKIDCGASFSFTAAASTGWKYKNLWITGSGATMGGSGASFAIYNCFFENTSSTAGRPAISMGSNNSVRWSEFVSQNGNAITGTPLNTLLLGCYIAHSDVGASIATTTGMRFERCIFENCKTAAVSVSTGSNNSFFYNTFYGASATPVGIGFRSTGSTAPNHNLFGNIFYGLATAIEISTTAQDTISEDWNDFNNNTTDRTLIAAGSHSITNAPSFAGAAQITGSTATSSGSVLTQSGGDFSTVTNNEDYLRVISGATAGIYKITAHDTTTLTVNNSLGTGSSIVYVVYTGHNFSPSGTMVGFPGTISESTGYPKMGAIQPQSTGGEKSHVFVGP